MDCDKKTQWCTNQDVRLCQMKSATNVYEGKKVYLCKECRKSEQGQFKYPKEK